MMEIYWLWLSMLPGVGTRLQKKMLARFGSPEAVYSANEEELCSVEGLGGKSVHHVLQARSLEGAKRVLAGVERVGARLLLLNDPLYPPMVSCQPQVPLVLYYRGTLRQQSCGVGIVGARRCTAYGKEVARQAAAFLAEQGIPVISGMARGIDAYANTACLQAGGYTLAFLGCGVDICFPAEHRELMQAIVEHGAVISAYPPGTEARPAYFPQRNFLISAWSYRLLVVEAARKSGSLITAKLSQELGHPVFAVPGSIYSRESAGTNGLIAAGAASIYLHPRQLLPAEQAAGAADVLAAATKAPQSVSPGSEIAQAESPLTDINVTKKQHSGHKAKINSAVQGDTDTVSNTERKIFSILAHAAAPMSTEELAARFGDDKKRFWETLALMVLQGKVENLPGGRVRKAGS